MTTLIRTYIESGYQPIPKTFLPDDAYVQGLQAFVYGCTDAVIINSARRTIYLAKRSQKPMIGWWWIGGRMNAGETKEQSIIRCFAREVGLTFPQDRFTLLSVSDYLWKDRTQKPQDIGCHPMAYTFTVELSPGELDAASRNLEPKEYDAGEGLNEFSRERLLTENVFQAVIDVYDTIFPPVAAIESGILTLPNPKADDDRRTILETNLGDGSVQFFHVKRDATLGNHFHRNKTETFVFIEGSGSLRTAEVDGKGEIAAEIRTFTIGPMTTVKIPPYQTHQFDLKAGTRFLCYSSAPFDPKDMPSCPLPDVN